MLGYQSVGLEMGMGMSAHLYAQGPVTVNHFHGPVHFWQASYCLLALRLEN